MLRKLLKYDVKFIFKGLFVFWALSLFFAVLTRIFLGIENSFILNVIGKVCSGVTISMIFNIIINNVMRMWARFSRNFYKDESYLTHTLPVKKSTHYLSKVIAASIALFLSIAIITLSLFIAYYSKENIQIVKMLLLPMAKAYDSEIVTFLLGILFVVFLEFANALQCGFAGIILGNRMNTGKAGFSVLFGFACYIFTQSLGMILIFIVALFNKDLMNLFITNELLSMDVVKTITYLAIAAYTLILIAGYFVNQKLFQKGVNVE